MPTYHHTYYNEYRYEATPAGNGTIVKVFSRATMPGQPIPVSPWEYQGSYFSQEKVVPRGSCYSAGPNALHENFR